MVKDRFDLYMVHELIVMMQHVQYPIEMVDLFELVWLIEVAFDTLFVAHFVKIYYRKCEFSKKIEAVVY
jgi:hypothetical protein